MMRSYIEMGEMSIKEKEAFVLAFLDRMIEQCRGGPLTLNAKDIVVGFYGHDDESIGHMDLLQYCRQTEVNGIHSVGAAFMGSKSVDAPPLPVPGKDGPCLLSDYVMELVDIVRKDKNVGVTCCKSFMALLCNIIDPEPVDIDEARKLVSRIRAKLVDFLFNGLIPDSDKNKKEYVASQGKHILRFLAHGGPMPESDIVILVHETIEDVAIKDCHTLVETLLTLGKNNGLKIMGGLAPYQDLRKYDYVCLSDFVTMVCTWPEPENVEDGIPFWKILTNFIAVMLYGLKDGQDEDKNIDVFNQLMACQKTIKEKSLN